jgi:phosphate acetyltransferase
MLSRTTRELLKKFKTKGMKIVLSELDERVLNAASIVLRYKIADIVIIGKDDKRLRKKYRLGRAEFIEPDYKYAELLYELRKDKGMTRKEAAKLSKDPIYFGALMVKSGYADGMIAGAVTSSDRVIRAALQVIGYNTTVSGAFLIITPKKCYGERFFRRGLFIFADCAVNVNPDYKKLADIAETSADLIKMFGVEPRIAMLSYITRTNQTCTTDMCKAERLVKRRFPKLKAEEMQLDAAIDESVVGVKNPKSKVAGKANVLIFPNLHSANIGYKLVQRLGDAEAIGPILQGLEKPVNDLSRGCSVDDIVNLVIFTAYQANFYFRKKTKGG